MNVQYFHIIRNLPRAQRRKSLLLIRQRGGRAGRSMSQDFGPVTPGTWCQGRLGQGHQTLTYEDWGPPIVSPTHTAAVTNQYHERPQSRCVRTDRSASKNVRHSNVIDHHFFHHHLLSFSSNDVKHVCYKMQWRERITSEALVESKPLSLIFLLFSLYTVLLQ